MQHNDASTDCAVLYSTYQRTEQTLRIDQTITKTATYCSQYISLYKVGLALQAHHANPNPPRAVCCSGSTRLPNNQPICNPSATTAMFFMVLWSLVCPGWPPVLPMADRFTCTLSVHCNVKLQIVLRVNLQMWRYNLFFGLSLVC
jgi:hypothetical protein